VSAFAPLIGGCNCGAVRFEVTEPLVAATHCHCTRCQRRLRDQADHASVVAYAASWEEIPDDGLQRYAESSMNPGARR
jgi:hypothetical protein